MEESTPQMISRHSAERTEIRREIITSYNPQQNGVEERKNCSIMEAVKAMIHDQDLPMHMWAEAARTVMRSMIKIL
jgi:hypothetical protein